MSLKTLTKKQLLVVADYFSLSVDKSAVKSVILQDLVDAGVTEEDYVKFKGDMAAEKKKKEAGETVPEFKPDKVLLFMQRQNPTYEIRGCKFTHEHQFALMDADDAEWVVSNVEGFRPATPGELSDFYG
jgi:calcineurin-like phosphoesterase family protein